ncbi:Anther-specific protein agp1-like [Raphanus sativus]|uniref:Anther-specific protein BCP1-like n=1 Tax=Raphanus sativus TaxID=3726 RepID=A0A6J0LYB6_RAPSA|nr:anther-specific protein BCP1-like [Raphanus sativus]KAJ4888333.1 Anther-specific protein agp1-like [Raphanus sativus]
MVRLHVALLLLFIAVSTVIVSATDKPSVTTSGPPTATAPTSGDIEVAQAPADDNAIGTTDDDAPPTPGDDDVAVAGPIGSETSYANYPPPQQTSGSGLTAMIGTVSIAATMVGSLLFF